MQKIKVLRIIDRLNIGGPAIHCILTTGYLNPEKFTSRLITGQVSEFEGDMAYLATLHHVQYTVVPTLGREISFLRDWKTLWQLLKIIWAWKPDIVHTHKSKAGALGRLAAFVLRVPGIVHTFHGHVFHSYFGKWKTCFFLQMERLLAKISDRIIVISEEQLEEISKKYKVAPWKKCTVIRLGFDFSSLAEYSRHQGWLRHQFSIPVNQKIVGIVARLTRVKNHHLFLQAARMVLDKMKDVCFAVIGDGECREALEQEAQRLCIQDHVRFTGWIEHPAQIYADLDIVALTSDNEGTPVTLIEAMYCKKPVVASKVGGVASVVQPGKTGWLVAPGDAAGFAEAIQNLLADPDQCTTLGQQGYIFVEQQFALSRLLHDLEIVYENILTEKHSTC